MATRKGKSHATKKIPAKAQNLKLQAGNDPLRFLDLLPKEMPDSERTDKLLEAFPEMDWPTASDIAKGWHGAQAKQQPPQQNK